MLRKTKTKNKNHTKYLSQVGLGWISISLHLNKVLTERTAKHTCLWSSVTEQCFYIYSQ